MRQRERGLGLRTGAVAACALAALTTCALTGGAAARPTRSALDRARWWTAAPAGGAIQGFASQVSAVAGDTVDLKVSVRGGERYRIVVYRLGDRSGGGDSTVLACLPGCADDEAGIDQASIESDPATGLLRARWQTTDRLTIPASWRSGYVVLQLELTTGPAAGRASWLPLVVRQAPTEAPARILVQIPSNTLEAYNDWGVKSTYVSRTGGTPATKVSFDRPYSQTMIGWEYPLVRFLESRGYDVAYQTDLDTDRDPASLQRHRLVVVDGHDEYWTSGIRDAFEGARDAGTNLLFFGANIGYWQVRYEDEGRTLVAYKATAPDPDTDPRRRTTLFRDLGRPECGLLGIQHQGGNLRWGIGDYTVAPGTAQDPWFAGTGFSPGDRLTGVVSTETDTIPGWLLSRGETCLDRPLTVLFRSDRGGDTEGDATFTRYVAASGARVASAGTLELGRSIDDVVQRMSGQPSMVDPRMQRFLANALDDLQRPAPVMAASARWRHGALRFRIQAHDDVRAHAVLYGIPPGGRYVEGSPSLRTVRERCPGRFSATSTAGETFVAVSTDRWGSSAPTPVVLRGRRGRHHLRTTGATGGR